MEEANRITTGKDQHQSRPLVIWCFATFVISSHAERSDWVLGVVFQFVPIITPEVQNLGLRAEISREVWADVLIQRGGISAK